MTLVRAYCLTAAAFCLALLEGPTLLIAGELASDWSQGKRESKARLLAGTLSGKPMAAVEIVLADGWKTYWRSPGDGGGVPPVFNWSKSENVAKATVLFPVPNRYSDKDGDTLGFKGAVIFPVAVTPKDSTKPVNLTLVVEYGICREVCIPVEAELSVVIPAGDGSLLPDAAVRALERVPRLADARRPNDPKLIKSEVRLDGPNPSIAVEAEFAGDTANAAVYIESSKGDFIPLPKLGSGKPSGPGRLRFEIDLTGTVDPADIRGKDAIVTLLSDFGLSEATFKFE